VQAEPFTSYEPVALLNIARFLLNNINYEDGVEPPARVSLV
jgi:hypothetical protein